MCARVSVLCAYWRGDVIPHRNREGGWVGREVASDTLPR